MELLFAPEEVQADRELVTLAVPISVYTVACSIHLQPRCRDLEAPMKF